MKAFVLVVGCGFWEVGGCGLLVGVGGFLNEEE